MNNAIIQQNICQCGLEIFGYNLEFDLDLDDVITTLQDGFSGKLLSKNKWKKCKAELFELYQDYLEFRSYEAAKNKRNIELSSNFLNGAFEYCLLSTYYDHAKDLFRKDGVPLCFVRSPSVEEQSGFHMNIPLDKLSEDDFNKIICVY